MSSRPPAAEAARQASREGSGATREDSMRVLMPEKAVRVSGVNSWEGILTIGLDQMTWSS